MLPIRENHPLKQLFTGLVEHAFQAELGICDPHLADYIADLLIDFVHVDNMTIARTHEGRPIGDIAEVLARWEHVDELPHRERDRRMHQRIGDYALFWTGVYPEGVRRSAGPVWRDRLTEYVAFGKRSYAIASELTLPQEQPPAILLRRLSEDFEFCVHGLGIVRRDLTEQRPIPPGAGSELIY